MPTEIERKFLVKNNSWHKHVDKTITVRQNYILSKNNSVVRVRQYGDDYYLCIKGETQGISRKEFEYKITKDDYFGLMAISEDVAFIHKDRSIIKQGNLTWEIDIFSGDNQGLVIAEIELDSENQEFEIPEWLGEEVSHDYRYFNSELAKNPYTKWALDINYSEIFQLKMEENDADAKTIGEYLESLLLGIWNEGESFSGKRPFGNSGWEHELQLCLAQHGYIKCKKELYKDDKEEFWEYDINDEGYLEANEIISKCIVYVFGQMGDR